MCCPYIQWFRQHEPVRNVRVYQVAGCAGAGCVECGREGARAGAGSFEPHRRGRSASQLDSDEGTFSLLTGCNLLAIILL